MSPFLRLGLAARVFFLAAVLGLALLFRVPEILQGTLFLSAIATVAYLASARTYGNDRWVCIVEGILAALVIGLTLPGGVALLPYLLVPALLAGVASGTRAVVTVVVTQLAAFVLVLTLGRASIHDGLEVAAPWLLASLGAGLMGGWIGQLRGRPDRQDEESYESARRLLSQLRTVARRLSSGLEPISLADQALATAHSALDDSQSGLFVRTEGGVLAPLAYRGTQARHQLLPEGTLVDTCWTTAEPAVAPQPTGRVEHRARTVLPLRSGGRMFGVLISEAPAPPSPEALASVMRDLDEQSLRLDTALVFDEVRSLATTEERQRLAREIHDGVAQEIASLGYLVDELADTSPSEPHRVRLKELRRELSRVVSELRLSIFDLRSEISPSGGLGSAISDHVRAVGSRSGFTVHLTLDEAPTRLRSEVETELLRIVQEAITNARKHSDAENLWVDCRIRPPNARITVQDDGGGMGQGRPDSYGLKIMHERASRAGARLEVGDAPSRTGALGTRVSVTLDEQRNGVAHEAHHQETQ